MWKSIDIKKLNEMLLLYNKSDKKKCFEKFIEEHEEDLDIIDSVGVITKGDFENNFDKDFIEEHFEDLAHTWFTGLKSQVDFGIIEECIKDEFKNLFEGWRAEKKK